MFYVNVYDVDKAFGGPEEGGWWFTYGTPACGYLTKRFITIESALAYQKELREGILAEKNEGLHELSSVLCEGVYDAFVEEHEAKAFPEERPHYE